MEELKKRTNTFSIIKEGNPNEKIKGVTTDHNGKILLIKSHVKLHDPYTSIKIVEEDIAKIKPDRTD